MTQIVLNSDYEYVKENEDILEKWLEERFEYEDVDMMKNIFLIRSYAPFVKKVIKDLSRSEYEKLDMLMHKLFAGYSLTIINGSMGEGKGTTTASIIQYAKVNGYLEKFGISKIVGFIPCPQLPFIDDYVWDISQVPENAIAYCPEMALVFGNTAQEYSKNDSHEIPKEILKFRQKKLRFLGETQNDSMVNINFYKHLESEVFRYVNKKARGFKREQNQNFNPLLDFIMPPSAIDSHRNPILENLTKIFYDDNEGFIRVTIPRTEKYTKELSEAFKDVWSLIEKHLVKAIQKDGEDFLKMKQKLEMRGVDRTPNQWNEFLKKHNINADLSKSESKKL